MERLDCLIMCTFYSSCTRVIVLCTNLIRYVQNVFRYARNTFRYVHDVKYGHVLKRLNLPRLAEGGGREAGGGGLRANICYYISVVRDSLKFDMQHSHVLKKVEL